MLSNRLAFAALGIACVAAAAGGGYLASRQNVVPAPTSAASVESTPAQAEASAATTPNRSLEAVQETEALVGDTKVKGTAVPAPANVAEAKSGRDTVAARPPAETPRSTQSPSAGAPAARQDMPALERTWPSSAAAEPPQAVPAPSPSASASAPDAAAPGIDEQPAAELVTAPEPPERTFEELVVSADSVIGLQTETTISSERAHVEDLVEARVTRDVRVNDRVAIPAGAKATGTVTVVDRGGKFKERARLGINFDTLVLADGTRLPISTETIYRDGDVPNSASKVGGAAIGGAIIGAILGGGRGAVLGGLAGAGGGAAVAAAGDRNAATLPAGSPLTVRILSPVTVTLEDKE